MTVGQVAETVKVAATTVRMWIHSGKLRASRPGIGRGQGRTFRISRANLKEFVASVQERVPDSEAEAMRLMHEAMALLRERTAPDDPAHLRPANAA
jgi:excisionase family DNA binding protein